MKTTIPRHTLLVALFTTTAVIAAAPASGQQTFTVDRLTDTGEGAGLSGDLRYCMTQAQNADTITFAVVGTINLTGALPDLTKSISINGPGANLLTVRRNTGGDYRVFTVSSGATVLISRLTISNGRSDSGAGVANSGTLTVDSCRVSSNLVAVYGGGIFNQGLLTVVNSTVSGNQAVAIAFPINVATGGGIFNQGLLMIVNSTVASNLSEGGNAGLGGGIFNGGEAIISNSTVVNNAAYGLGGHGGGIYNGGTLSISHSTVVGNVAEGEIADNGGGIVSQGILGEPAVFHSRNTIIAGNGASYCADILGSLGSLGHNLIGDASFGCTDPDPTDLVNVNPLLGPLQDNGGPTPTLALLPGSPAIDAGDNTDAPAFDQRGPGFPRIVNGIIDIGAFEVQ